MHKIATFLKIVLSNFLPIVASFYNKVKQWFLRSKWNYLFFFFSIWFLLLSFTSRSHFEYNISKLRQFFQTHSYQERDQQSELPLVYNAYTTLRTYVTPTSRVLILFPVQNNTQQIQDKSGYYIVYRLNYRLYPYRLNFGSLDNQNNLILFTYGKPYPQIHSSPIKPSFEDFDYILSISNSFPISNTNFHLTSQSSDLCLYRKNL